MRIALVGCGKHMSDVLFPVLRLMPQVQVQIVTSRHNTSARLMAQTWGVPKVVEAWQDLSSNEVDAVIVSGPVELHQAVVSELPSRGIAVFVEKPVVANLEELNKLLALAPQFKAPVQVGYNLRFAPVVHQVFKDLAGQGPLQIEVLYASNKPNAPLWGLTSLLQSQFLAISVHPLSLMQSLLGPPQRPEARFSESQGAIARQVFELHFAGGHSSRITVHNQSERFVMQIKIRTSHNRELLIDQLHEVSEIQGGQKTRLVQYDRSPLKLINNFSGYSEQLQHFEHLVNTRQTSSTDLQDSLWMYELLQKLIVSNGRAHG